MLTIMKQNQMNVFCFLFLLLFCFRFNSLKAQDRPKSASPGDINGLLPYSQLNLLLSPQVDFTFPLFLFLLNFPSSKVFHICMCFRGGTGGLNQKDQEQHL